MPMDALIALRAAGVGLLLDASAPGGCPPSATGAPTSVRSARPVGGPAPGAADAGYEQWVSTCALRLALVPEGRAGWMGRPGLSGSRGGRDWSPRLRGGRAGGGRSAGHRRGAHERSGQRSGGVPGRRCYPELGFSSSWPRKGACAPGPGSAIWGRRPTGWTSCWWPCLCRGRRASCWDTGRWTKERQPQRLPLVMGA